MKIRNIADRSCLKKRNKRQKGVATIEFLVAVPVLLLVVFSTIELTIYYQVKSALNTATLISARSGSVNNLNSSDIVSGFARGILPVIGGNNAAAGFLKAKSLVGTSVEIKIMNPTKQAFIDFGEFKNGRCEITNDRLHIRSSNLGSSSRLSLQDANIIKLRITYGYKIRVPVVGKAILSSMQALQGDGSFSATLTGFEQQLINNDLIPITSTALVRMQSPARATGSCSNVHENMMLSRDEAIQEQQI